MLLSRLPPELTVAAIAYVALGYVASAVAWYVLDDYDDLYRPLLSWPVVLFVVVVGLAALRDLEDVVPERDECWSCGGEINPPDDRGVVIECPDAGGTSILCRIVGFWLWWRMWMTGVIAAVALIALYNYKPQGFDPRLFGFLVGAFLMIILDGVMDDD